MRCATRPSVTAQRRTVRSSSVASLRPTRSATGAASRSVPAIACAEATGRHAPSGTWKREHLTWSSVVCSASACALLVKPKPEDAGDREHERRGQRHRRPAPDRAMPGAAAWTRCGRTPAAVAGLRRGSERGARAFRSGEAQARRPDRAAPEALRAPPARAPADRGSRRTPRMCARPRAIARRRPRRPRRPPASARTRGIRSSRRLAGLAHAAPAFSFRQTLEQHPASPGNARHHRADRHAEHLRRSRRT